MNKAQIFLFAALPVVLILAGSCSDAPRPSKSPAAPETTGPANPPVTQQTAPVPEKPQPGLLDTSRSLDRLSDIKAPVPEAGARYAAAPESGRSAAQYPAGYITRENTPLLAEPKSAADQIGVLKQYEVVSILEFLMVDDQGKPTNFPTWYKIERKDKKRGWVSVSNINSGGGG